MSATSRRLVGKVIASEKAEAVKRRKERVADAERDVLSAVERCWYEGWYGHPLSDLTQKASELMRRKSQ